MAAGEHNQSQMRSSAKRSNDSQTNLIAPNGANKPIGISVFGLCFKFRSPANKRTYHKALVLCLTFIAYAAFHMGRRPLSVVKNVLNRNCSAPALAPSGFNNFPGGDFMLSDATHNAPSILIDLSQPTGDIDVPTNQQEFTTFDPSLDLAAPIVDNSCSWAPFDNDTTANQLLAVLDTSFLLSYALAMFVSGIVAERMNLRYFITLGCIAAGGLLIAFGLAYELNIHSMSYFIAVQILSGIMHSTGWPVVVTCVGNWFPPNKRGLIYGFWNSHTNLGNILGATIAGYFSEKDWGLSFIVPGLIMITVGILLFLFLVPKPNDVGLSKEIVDSEGSSRTSISSSTGDEPAPVLKTIRSASTINGEFLEDAQQRSVQDSIDTVAKQSGAEEHKKAVSFTKALMIPGVIEYAMCLFFSKLVNYTFLYWLPRYITASTSLNSEDSAYLSTPFDIGGAAGAVLAGYLSDRYKANGIVCNAMLVIAIPALFTYQHYGALSNMHNICLQLLVGLLVNGPYCLITTAVSADLGARVKDGNAMATVAAIIDGMGSVGAVLGPLFAGFVSQSGNWQAVFLMLMLSNVLASLCLTRLTMAEVKDKFFKPPRPLEDMSEVSRETKPQAN